MSDVHIIEFGPARPHPEYVKWAPIWRKCRDVLSGEEAVKAAGELYLPRMTVMTDMDYDGYKSRALFYGASHRTLQGLMGALLRKEPIIHVSMWNKYPKTSQDDIRAKQEETLRLKLDDILRNITQTGTDLQAFTRDLVAEILAVGRVGLLTDMPPSTLASQNPVPYFRLYRAENIINWREMMIGGIPVLDQVILQEVVETPSPTGFGSDWVVQYRELALDEQGEYIQNVYVIDAPATDKDEPVVRQIVDTIKPTYLGKPLKEIPFFFISPSHMRPEIDRPPLLDLFNVNLSHYRSSADLEHGRHFTALPTPVVSGVEDEDENGKPTELRIGSGTAWLLPQGGQARMLEFNGQGLKHLENALKDKEAQMVNLGGRMMEQDKRASETAEALRLRQAGDIASLNVLADTVGAALTRAVRILSWWAGFTPSTTDDTLLVNLNKDFFESRLAPGQISALVAAWQAGAFTFRDLFENLVRGEIIDAQRDYDTVKDEIEEELEARDRRALKRTAAMGKIEATQDKPITENDGTGNKERPNLLNDNGNRPRASKAE